MMLDIRMAFLAFNVAHAFERIDVTRGTVVTDESVSGVQGSGDPDRVTRHERSAAQELADVGSQESAHGNEQKDRGHPDCERPGPEADTESRCLRLGMRCGGCLIRRMRIGDPQYALRL